jgi:hypothetical protein
MNCEHCGAANLDTARFCNQCGRPLAAAETTLAPAPQASKPPPIPSLRQGAPLSKSPAPPPPAPAPFLPMFSAKVGYGFLLAAFFAYRFGATLPGISAQFQPHDWFHTHASQIGGVLLAIALLHFGISLLRSMLGR